MLLASCVQALGQYVAVLKEVSEEHNIAVVVTNQVMSTPDSFGMGDGLKVKVNGEGQGEGG